MFVDHQSQIANMLARIHLEHVEPPTRHLGPLPDTYEQNTEFAKGTQCELCRCCLLNGVVAPIGKIQTIGHGQLYFLFGSA